MTVLEETEETIEPAVDVLLDARGVDHHPPARLLQLGAMGRWSRRCVVATVMCALVAWTAHGAAERLKPEESAEAWLLRGTWSWEPRAQAVTEAIEDARLGKPIAPQSLMVLAQAPGSADTADRSTVLVDIGFRQPSARIQEIVVEWDLAMYDMLVAQQAWVVRGGVAFNAGVFPTAEFDADQLYADLSAAEAADRVDALRDYGRMSALDSWYTVGSWVAAGLAVIALLAAVFLRFFALRRQWGDVRRYRLARSAYRRLVRARERIG